MYVKKNHIYVVILHFNQINEFETKKTFNDSFLK